MRENSVEILRKAALAIETRGLTAYQRHAGKIGESAVCALGAFESLTYGIYMYAEERVPKTLELLARHIEPHSVRDSSEVIANWSNAIAEKHFIPGLGWMSYPKGAALVAGTMRELADKLEEAA